MSDTFQVEMRWRCSACRAENLGRHKKCQSCGKKKGREAFYDAPGTASPTRADAVTDPTLIERAEAGTDWECRYCRSHERRDSGECGNCGSDQSDSKDHETQWDDGTISKGGAKPRLIERVRTVASKARGAPWRQLAPKLMSVIGVMVVALFAWFIFRTRVVDAEVVSGSWTCDVAVERYKIVHDEGFSEDRPGDAFDVSPIGMRHHHYDQVPDGWKTEHYSVSEACGQTCSTSPVRCTSNGNGFKTCSGGTTSCSTKYCSVSKTRQVQKYRDVSVRRTWYAWNAWRWRHRRTITETGHEASRFTCPSSARVGLNAGVGTGERERASETRRFEVTFEDTDHDRYKMSPNSLDEFASLPPGKHVKLRVGIARNAEIVRDR